MSGILNNWKGKSPKVIPEQEQIPIGNSISLHFCGSLVGIGKEIPSDLGGNRQSKISGFMTGTLQ